MEELRCSLHQKSGCDTPSLRVCGCESRCTVLGDDIDWDIGFHRHFNYLNTFSSSILTIPSAVSLHIRLSEYLGGLGFVWCDGSIRHHASWSLTADIVLNGFRKVSDISRKVFVALAVGSCVHDEDLLVPPCDRPGVRLFAISSHFLAQTVTTQLMPVGLSGLAI